MFNDLPISEGCARELELAVKSGRLSHAVILEGADEAVRTRAARLLAKAVVCRGDDRPCGICPSCRKAEADCHPDIHFLKKAEGASFIKVDEIREMREQAMLLPNDGDKSVFIIFEAQFMDVPAQNAILKSFEEPAAHVSFILTCGSKSALLDTIVSRASSYYLGGGELSSDEEETREARDLAAELALALSQSTEAGFLKRTGVLQKEKTLFKPTLLQFKAILRDALVCGADGVELLSGSDDAVKALAARFSVRQLMDLIEQSQALAEQCDAFVNRNLLVTRLCSTFFQIKEGTARFGE